MILAFVLILVLCSALSFPQYNSFSDSGDSDIKLVLKKNAKLGEDHDLDLVEQVYDAQTQEQIAVDASKRKLENSTLGSAGGYSSPQKLWSLHCEPYCVQVYAPGFSTEGISTNRQNDDDILLHLSGDKDLYKFLEWTMEQLGSVNSYNASGSYYTGLNMWKKGRREMPLYVEEPKYIVVRREPDDLEQKLNFGHHDADLPFIPPRGRKYFPHMENIYSNADMFIPHRGKKDKLKDIFKYDELFFPQRGKKRTSSVVESGGILHGQNEIGTSGGYYNYRSASEAKNDGQAFVDCLTPRCDDITFVAAAAAGTAPSPHQQQMVTNQAENINAMVSSAFHLPLPWQAVLADANNDAIATADGHQDACAVVECQKENDVKMNGFDQSVRAQQKRQRQQQHSEGGVFNNYNNNRQRRRLLSSSSSASVEAGASTFLPLSQPDQLNRLHRYPIRKKQWRDYFIQQMAAQSRKFPPF